MEQIELQADTRDVLGKKVRFLRRQNITPVHLFGRGIKSLALQCDTVQLQSVLAKAGRTHIVGLRLDKGKKPKNVVVREVQKEPCSREIIHVDFYQVQMTEKIKVEVPILLVGEAPALKHKENSLLQELNILSVECLPDKMPDSVELDITSLAEAEQGIYVKDISLGEGVTVLNDPEHIVVKISAKRLAAEEEEAVAEEAVVEEVAESSEENKEE